MPTFLTSFAPPPAVSNLIVEADIDASAVRLSWDATSVPEVDFRGYRISRSLNNGLTWELLALLAGVNDVSLDDYNAPLNVPLLYRVTQSNVDAESDPEEAGVLLASEAWYAVTPGDPSLTFPIRRQTAGEVERHKEQDVFRPMGRPGALVVSDVVWSETGGISFTVRPDELGTIALLKQIQAVSEGTLMLKATDGSVWLVRYGDIKRTFMRGGLQQVSFPFIGVG